MLTDNFHRLFFKINKSLLISLSFLLLILTGACLLTLPISHVDGNWRPFIDALFTATSASCVTGLAVWDTGKDLSIFGQLVLLFLIQVGGLGIMTVTTLCTIGLGKRIHFGERLLISESLNQAGPSGILKMTIQIIKYTFIIEGFFGTLLAFYFYDDIGAKAFYWGYWHAVSAFCNAGFDLLGNYTSLVNYQEDYFVNICIMSLIILGGIGFTVIDDVHHKRSWKRFSLHTKIVLIVNTLLIFVGTIGMWCLEHNNPMTIGSLPTSSQWLASMFQAVSARTAGFNTISLGDLNNPSLFLLMVLMYIGASPTSTGGGIKTTTFAVLICSTLAQLRNKQEVVLFRRRLEDSTVAKANSIFILTTLWIAISFFLLLVLDTGNSSFQFVLFELFSAFGTVGLGIGITGEWNVWCKLILIATMYIGRVGILTFGLSFFNRKLDRVRYPSENIIIG